MVESVEFAPLLNMKNSPLITTLLAVLAISAVLSLWFCWSYIQKSRELRTLQIQKLQIEQRMGIINQLMTDAVEYSKKNHDIDKILEPFGVTNRPPAK